jgi:hypothetical protein
MCERRKNAESAKNEFPNLGGVFAILAFFGGYGTLRLGA